MTATPPVVPFGEDPTPYRVPPQKRSFDVQGAPVSRQIAGCRDDGNQGLFTSDGTLCVSVQESIYPGGQAEPIKNKWVYVLLDGKLVAEAEARTPEEWWVGYKGNRKAQPEERPLKLRTQGFVRLDAGPSGSPNQYAFFLSPIRLTPKALDYLFDHTAPGAGCAVVLRSFKGSVNRTIAVPEPHRWACDAHQAYYQPLLNEYKTYVEEPERAASLLVAGVLKGWIGDKDPAHVEGTLQKGQPQTFLDEYNAEEKRLREAAEAAMAYTAECVQSPEHRAVELAATEARGAALANLYCQYAAVTYRADETEPGRAMLAALMAEQDRFPRKYLFADSAPEPKGFEFAEWRFAWLGALAAFEQLVPAWTKHVKASSVSSLELLAKHFEGIDVKTLKGRDITIHRNILKNRDLRTGFGGSATAVQKYNQHVAGLLSESEKFRAELAEAKKLTGVNGKLDKMHSLYGPWLDKIKLSAGSVVEMANFVLAVDALYQAKQDRGDKVWSLVGASADLAAQVLAIVEAVMAKRAGGELGRVAARQILKVAGPLGLISGACDMREFVTKSAEATTKNNYGAAVGQGIAAAGAAAVSVGGGMALAFALSGEVLFASAAGGPLGLVVGGIGSIVIIGGCLLAAWLTDNDFQSFAKLCRFGKDANDGKVVYFDWASGGIGSGGPISEAKVLIDLLAQFKVKRQPLNFGDQVVLTIEPGYTTEASVFEVHLDRRAYRGETAPEGMEVLAITCGEQVKVLTDSGTRHELRVSRDAKDSSRIKSLELKLPLRNENGQSFPVKDIYVRLNLTGNASQTAPPLLRLVKLPYEEGDYFTREYSSTDTKLWIETNGSEYHP